MKYEIARALVLHHIADAYEAMILEKPDIVEFSVNDIDDIIGELDPQTRKKVKKSLAADLDELEKKMGEFYRKNPGYIDDPPEDIDVSL